jgi:hypothetical protein
VLCQFSGGAAVQDVQPVRVTAGRLLAEDEAVPDVQAPQGVKAHDLPPAASSLLATLLALDPTTPPPAAPLGRTCRAACVPDHCCFSSSAHLDVPLTNDTSGGVAAVLQHPAAAVRPLVAPRRSPTVLLLTMDGTEHPRLERPDSLHCRTPYYVGSWLL